MEDIKQDAIERYSILNEENLRVAIYRSHTASNDNFSVERIFNEVGDVYSSVYRGAKEFVVLGDHTLSDVGKQLFTSVYEDEA